MIEHPPMSLVLLCSAVAIVASCGPSGVKEARPNATRTHELKSDGTTTNDMLGHAEREKIAMEQARAIELAWSGSMSADEELRRMGYYVTRDCFPRRPKESTNGERGSDGKTPEASQSPH